MQGKCKIVIVENHTILREGLKALLTSNPDFEVAGEAEDGLSALTCVERLLPDLVLMDLSMPRMNGMEAIKEIKTRYPKTKVLVLTVHEEDEFILAALKFGADGYVLKEATHAELVVAIKSILKGNRYISAGISEKVIGGYLEGKKIGRIGSSWDSLTKQERIILKLIAEGHKNKEVSQLLCISEKTVKKHRSNLMNKLDVHNASALATLAVKKGLISE